MLFDFVIYIYAGVLCATSWKATLRQGTGVIGLTN